MKYLRKSTSDFSKFLLVVVFLAAASAALATNTWYADGVNGSDNNDCKSPQTACRTIGNAISLATSGDSVMVAPATYTENFDLKINLTIIGSDARTTIVDGRGVRPVFTIRDYASVTLAKLTIRNGYSENYGGGIRSYGTTTINDSVITGNSAYFGGGIYNFYGSVMTINNSSIRGNHSRAYGGGFYTRGITTVNNSTITANSATYGGGIDCDSDTTTINNSTIGGNRATQGGGLWVAGTTVAIVNNSTITGNSATQDGGGIKNTAVLTLNNATVSGNTAVSGGGIWFDPDQYTGGSTTFQNSIVGNNSGANCVGSLSFFSNGYNLSSDDTCYLNGPGDMNDIDPKLGNLGSYGGATQTIPLLVGSPAIDAANPNGCTDGSGNLLKTDQRGAPRPGHGDTGRCDIGAFERQEK